MSSEEHPVIAAAVRLLAGIALVLLLALLTAGIANPEECHVVHDDGINVWCCPPAGTCTIRRRSGEVEA